MDTESLPPTAHVKTKKMWPWLLLAIILIGGAAAGAMYYQNATDFGFVEVKLREPEIAAVYTIDGKPLELKDGKSGKIPAGKHTLEITARDYETVTKGIWIKRGATENIEIDLRSTIPPDPVAERKKRVAKLIAQIRDIAAGKATKSEDAMKIANELLDLEKESQDALELRGNLYLERNMLDEALADFNASLKVTGDRPAAFLGIGKIHFKRGNMNDCIAQCSAALNIDPSQTMAQLYRGLAQFRKGEREQGIADATAFLAKHPDHGEALAQRAVAHAELEDNAEALQDLDRLLKLEPKNAKMLMARSEVNGRLGNLEQAVKDRKAAIALDSTLGTRAEPIIADLRTQLLKKTMLPFEKQAAEKAAQARQRYRVGNKDDVQRLAGEALDLDRSNADLDKHNADANALMAWVLIELDGGDLQPETRIKAMEHCNEAIRADGRCALAYLIRSQLHKNPELVVADATAAIRLMPLSAEAYGLRAGAYKLLLEYDQAAHDAKLALLLDPREASAIGTIAYIEAISGNYDQALKKYTEYLNLRPKDAHAYLDRAGLYNRNNDVVKCKADQKRATDLDPDLENEEPTVFPDPRVPPSPTKLSEADATRVKGLLAEAKKNHDARKLPEALKAIDDLLEIDQTNLPARFLRAEVLIDAEDYARAVKECNRILAIKPNMPEAYEVRARANEDDAAVIADLTVLLRLKPEDAQAWESRAFHYFRIKNFDQARSDYDAALVLKPTNMFKALAYRGICHALLGNYDRAHRDMKAADGLERDRDDAYFHWMRGGMLARLGNKLGAEQEKSRALKINPKIGQMYPLPLFPNPPGEIEVLEARPTPEPADAKENTPSDGDSKPGPKD